MPDAKASGSDGAAAGARARGHNQGNQGRSCTAEQKAAVLRIRRCDATAFYEILDLESVRRTCTESDIKKAYRKQSLLTHPDKNAHEHADEAFKMVSRAFGILGDKDKRDKFDRFGTDPDSRFASAAQQAQNPFSGFSSRQSSGGMGGGRRPGGGGGWDEDISPEEMFARFFGGGGGGFGGPFGGAFDTGPQFMFNFGGGPGIRVHQFGGARPRRRPRDTQNGQPDGQQQESSGMQNLISMLPILLFFVIPLLTSLFGGDGSGRPPTPNMAFDRPQAPYTHQRLTPVHNIKYFVRQKDIVGYSGSQLADLDRVAEQNVLHDIRNGCIAEQTRQRQMREEAQGWFYQDEVKMALANALEMPHCNRWTSLMDKKGKK